MRRLNDIKKVADFIVGNFKQSEVEVQVNDGSIDLYLPYLPSNIVSLVSSDIRIGVFPCGSDSVLVNVYKV